MSALTEIQRDIDRLMALAEREVGSPLTPAAKKWAKSNRLQVQIGGSAEQSILAVTGDDTLPETIDDVPVVLTSAFPGFEVVLV